MTVTRITIDTVARLPELMAAGETRDAPAQMKRRVFAPSDAEVVFNPMNFTGDVAFGIVIARRPIRHLNRPPKSVHS